MSTVLSLFEMGFFSLPKALGKGALVPEKRIQLISENRPRLKRRQLAMNLAPWTNKKTLITLTIIATLATTTINGPKFGLYSVDLETKSRKSSESAEVYKQIIG